MSVCAVMLVRDEGDIIGHTIRHLLTQVDHVVVSDNLSSDGTTEIAQAYALEFPGVVHYVRDEDPAYYQSVKTTELARQAAAQGFQWVLPCDADEFWYAPDRRPIRDYLAGIAPDVSVVKAHLFNHLPTAFDNEAIDNPFQRITWRLREHAPIPKVCCRTHPYMHIHAGNHGATLPGANLGVYGLVVRHFTWRTEEQYLRKIVNGAAAYAATDLPPETGAHWRMFGNPPNPDAVREHFRTWFWSADPYANDSLIMDPAPL